MSILCGTSRNLAIKNIEKYINKNINKKYNIWTLRKLHMSVSEIS